MEWIRELPLSLRIGIFTGILGFIFKVVSNPFLVDAYGNRVSGFSVMNLVHLAGTSLVIVSVLCFLYFFVLLLIGLLFG